MKCLNIYGSVKKKGRIAVLFCNMISNAGSKDVNTSLFHFHLTIYILIARRKKKLLLLERSGPIPRVKITTWIITLFTTHRKSYATSTSTYQIYFFSTWYYEIWFGVNRTETRLQLSMRDTWGSVQLLKHGEVNLCESECNLYFSSSFHDIM